MSHFLDEINSALAVSTEKVREAQQLEAKLRSWKRDRRRLVPQEAELRQQLEKEIEDVEKLRRMSFRNLLSTVLRQKQKWEQKEWQEYLQADLKHTQVADSLEQANREIALLEEKLTRLGDFEAHHQQLLVRKEQALQESGDPAGRRLAELSQQQADAEADIKELREAIHAGKDAFDMLRQMNGQLSSAGNWGTWDLLGGGMISSMIKHNKLDGARDMALKAQRKLARFQNELADVGNRLTKSVDVGGGMKAVDMFFDNIFVDWMVQSRIKESSRKCEKTMREVQQMLKTCSRQLADAQQTVSQIKEQRAELLETQ